MDIQPLDPNYVAQTLSKPPFVRIPGVHNVRDLGSYPTSNPNVITKPGYIFRAGEVSGITPEGKSLLTSMGITTIFDLRSDTEIAKYNSPVPQIPEINIIHIPIFKTEDYSPEMMARRYQLYASGKEEAFMELYSQILDHGGPAFRLVLQHIRDNPTQGCLFHCTAGKDRTGVLAAIILKLAGVDNQLIAEDYALTRVGREPAREMIMARLSKEPLFASNNEAALNMFTCRHKTMIAFLSLLEDKYQGVEMYLRNYAGLSDDDIGLVHDNILTTR